jgi:hypothetical protein
MSEPTPCPSGELTLTEVPPCPACEAVENGPYTIEITAGDDLTCCTADAQLVRRLAGLTGPGESGAG